MKFDELKQGGNDPQIIVSSFSGVVLSWAIKDQGGLGHVNEQDNNYIKAQMAKRGFVNDVATENLLRTQTTCFWFKGSLMVFRKIKI